MISGFESYAPSAWYDANGLMLPGKTHKSVSTNSQRSKPKRSGSWRVIVSNTAAGACLAISALLLPTNTSVAMTAAAPVNTDDLTVAPTVQNEAVVLSPIREINRSFNQLFDSVRLGHSLIRVNLFSRQVFDFIDSQVIDDKRLSLGSWGEQIYRGDEHGIHCLRRDMPLQSARVP